MAEILLGSHVGMSGKEMFLGSVKEAAEYGANALMVYTGAPQNTRRKKKETMQRLEVLNKSNDGFYIANEDLKLRGPGDFFGVRQSGMMDFVLADIYTNADIMKQAADAVKQLEESGFDFSNLKNSRLEKQIGLARNI